MEGRVSITSRNKSQSPFPAIVNHLCHLSNGRDSAESYGKHAEHTTTILPSPLILYFTRFATTSLLQRVGIGVLFILAV
jgi:hypothetical protein